MYFNSIKVRLEYEYLENKFVEFEKFQFHKGAIGVISPTVNIANSCVFQFHKGAIGVEAWIVGFVS